MSTPLTVEDAFSLYLDDCKEVRKNTDSTLRTRRNRMVGFMRWKNTGNQPVDEISCETVNEWTAYSENKLKMTGNGRIYIRNQIRDLFVWLEDQRHIPINPLDTKKLSKIVKITVDRPPISFDQHLKLLAYFKENQLRWAFWHDACVLGWGTGLRLGDIAGLLWTDVDFDGIQIHTMPAKTRRFRKVVTVPMEVEVVETLNKLRDDPANFHHGSPLVFPLMHDLYASPTCNPMLPQMFRRACLAVGIPKRYSFHSYRHAFISRLLCAGVNPKIIQSMTGQSLAVLYAYVTVSPEAQRGAMEMARPKLGDKI